MKKLNKIPVYVIIASSPESPRRDHRALYRFWSEFKNEHGLRYKYTYHYLNRKRLIPDFKPGHKVIILGNPPRNVIRDRYYYLKFRKCRVLGITFDESYNYPCPVESTLTFHPMMTHFESARVKGTPSEDRLQDLTICKEYWTARTGLVDSLESALECVHSRCLPLVMSENDPSHLLAPFGSPLRIRNRRDITGVAREFSRKPDEIRVHLTTSIKYLYEFNEIPTEQELVIYYRTVINSFLFSRWS